ncbi:hypothetical protein [Butyrivibrio sp. VCB2006]|uniref:hypothetical protein n=1 Tax=Butyrivibrio sp. VCB2006 TaxID=1280679 RepID=UPI000417FB16|nr:hypothetical protein [Butyrivibrio sp. VCB2006]
MNRYKLAICDEDEIYCRRLDEYLRGNLGLGFEIFSFTSFEIMEKFLEKTKVSLLMIAESALEGIDDLRLSGNIKNVLVLDEGLGGSNRVSEDGAFLVNKRYINKYQPASLIVNDIVGFCTEESEDFTGLGLQSSSGKGRVIGLYSPLSKCGQTTLAVNIAERLAREGKVVFLSFESFSTLPQMLDISSNEDINDLMYYAELERDKFGLYLEKIKKTRNGVDYIMPAKTAMQIKEIGLSKVSNLYKLLAAECGYDYIVVDLTQYPDDFFEIAALSYRLIAITRAHASDLYKLKLFEEVLMQSGLEEVREKLVKCQVPDIRDKKAYEDYVRDLLESEGITGGSEV